MCSPMSQTQELISLSLSLSEGTEMLLRGDWPTNRCAIGRQTDSQSVRREPAVWSHMDPKSRRNEAGSDVRRKLVQSVRLGLVV